MAEEFDEDLVLYVLLVVFVMKALDVLDAIVLYFMVLNVLVLKVLDVLDVLALNSMASNDLVRNFLLCPLVKAADRDVFFRRCWRPRCTYRGGAVGKRFRGIGLGRPVVAAFCRVGVWKRV